MILVTLGTQDKSFDRLLKAIDKEIENKNIKIPHLSALYLYNHEFCFHLEHLADTYSTYEDTSDSYLRVPLTYYPTDEKPPSDGKHFPHK